MALILLVPIIVAAVLSFTNYSLGNPGFDWVGVQNYERLFTRSTYEKMFIATFTYVVTVVPISVGLGLGAALLGPFAGPDWGHLQDDLFPAGDGDVVGHGHCMGIHAAPDHWHGEPYAGDGLRDVV